MYSDKHGVRDLVEICAQKGIRTVIISPGSRNAPLTISFHQHPNIECLSIADERSAAFFALGMAQQTGQPVAITCTSGSAALNYAPAIAEAYYQKVPLLILTADRPALWIDQGDGQTIRQQNIFANYIKQSFQLETEVDDKDGLWQVHRIVSEAIDATLLPDCGPVHINLPFSEPLYNTKDYSAIPLPKVITTHPPTRGISETHLHQLAERWNGATKKLIITGQMVPNKALNHALEAIAADPSVAVLTETTSNLYHASFNPCIDRLITSITPDEITQFKPDLLVTCGRAIISKKIKALLRKHAPQAHWHIDPVVTHLDTFQCLTDNIPVAPEKFFKKLAPLAQSPESTFGNTWKGRELLTQEKHHDFLSTCAFSDLKAFELLLQYLPEGSNLQMGNSTSVRYVQLFNQLRGIRYDGNRGTSGIDGATSTAAGAARVNDRPTTIVTGDIGFFYDSNALWNDHLTPNLRIVVVNNGGGGIFRIIDGPTSTAASQQFFETQHQLRAEHLAKTYHIAYTACEDAASLETALSTFYQPTDRPALLEIITPTETNDKILKAYFKHLS